MKYKELYTLVGLMNFGNPPSYEGAESLWSTKHRFVRDRKVIQGLNVEVTTLNIPPLIRITEPVATILRLTSKCGEGKEKLCNMIEALAAQQALAA